LWAKHRSLVEATWRRKTMTTLHPRFVTDPDGNRLSVLLPITETEYTALIGQLEDLEDLEDARKARFPRKPLGQR